MTHKAARKVKETFNIINFEPMNPLQKMAADFFIKDNQNLFLLGSAGTGKTFLACHFALSDLIKYPKKYETFIIIRSCVPSRDMGFLPGTTEEKSSVYESPYSSKVNIILQRGDAYEIMKKKGKVKFETTSFLRGTEFNNCVLYVDEIQNMNYQELSTIMTRIGHNCKVIFSGDYKQTDLNSRKDCSGLDKLIKIVNTMKTKYFETINFTENEIVRSGLVKDFIISENRFNES